MFGATWPSGLDVSTEGTKASRIERLEEERRKQERSLEAGALEACCRHLATVSPPLN